MDIKSLLQSHIKEIDDFIKKYLLQYENKILREAILYSSLAGGKRLRSFLLKSSGDIFGADKENLIHAGIAVESIHTFSLIHDDLPALDNDDFRRGKPSCHKQFDESTAILAGDALFNEAFDILSSDKTHKDINIRIRLIKELAKTCGANGLIGGQVLDIANENKNISYQDIIKINEQKTAALFVFSVKAGGILGNANKKELDHLTQFALNFGILFQIMDDIEDDEYADENLHSLAEKYAIKAKQELDIFGKKASILKKIVDKVYS